ncbi:tetratricopeptide repeat protein [Orientia tsutsugamushi]|uniref:tetratricopeptide repeat protein n=1 Tax=Orientia tsutsugamushi TaxID=784 RepID=UPI001239BE80|nr:tetratricopeptide repeat protein [Orientia tsutsugamushi]
MPYYLFPYRSEDVAIKCNPDCIEAYINKGIALRELGQYQKAIENYDTAIRYRPDDAEAYVNK